MLAAAVIVLALAATWTSSVAIADDLERRAFYCRCRGVDCTRRVHCRANHASLSAKLGASMRVWLEALDPRRKIDSIERADVAAKLGAIAIFASIPHVLVITAFIDLAPVVGEATAALPASTPEERQVAEAIEAMFPQAIIVTTVTMAIVSLVVGVIQWRERSSLIPAICLAWTVYCAVMLPFDWMDQTAAAVAASRPFWLNALDIAVLPVGIAMYWAAFRGGRWLERHRREQAGAPAA